MSRSCCEKKTVNLKRKQKISMAQLSCMFGEMSMSTFPDIWSRICQMKYNHYVMQIYTDGKKWNQISNCSRHTAKVGNWIKQVFRSVIPILKLCVQITRGITGISLPCNVPCVCYVIIYSVLRLPKCPWSRQSALITDLQSYFCSSSSTLRFRQFVRSYAGMNSEHGRSHMTYRNITPASYHKTWGALIYI